MAFYDMCHKQKFVKNYVNMGIKRTVLIRQISPGLLTFLNRNIFFRKMEKTKITIFPLYFSPNSFEKCLLNWGGQGLIGLDQNFACCLSIHRIMGKCNAFNDFRKKLFFDPP